MPTFQEAIRQLSDVSLGYSVTKHLRGIESAAAMSEDEKKSIRERKLSALLAECFEYVEAYRPYRSLRNKAKHYPFEVLNELPALARGTYLKNPNVYFNPNLRAGQHTRSSNKTTVGYNYPVSKDAWSAGYAAYLWAYAQLGLSYTARHAVICGRLGAQNPIHEIVGALKRMTADNEAALFSSHIDIRRLSKYAEILQNPKLGYCAGEPSVMAALAALFEREGIQLSPSYKSLVASGETLLSDEREIIGRVFKVPVYASYATDDGLIACECEHGGMHIIEDNFIAESIDGHIAVTNLNNNAAPRMRYITDETGELTDTPCPCGRGGKRLISFESVKRPLYTAPDGRLIPGRVVDMAAERFYNIARYRLEQRDAEHAVLTAELRTAAAHDEAAELHKCVCGLMPGTLVELKSSVSR